MLEQYFKNDEINIKSHIKGYVSEKDLDKTAIDNQCVTDCNNMDFYPDHDRRRNPFDVYLSSLATLITDLELTDYKIHNICEKRFYDKDGNYADCLIAVVTYQGIGTAKPTKIFINQWYNPGSDYENGSGTASDFFPPTGDWMEITEYYDTSSYTFEAGSWVIDGVTYTLRSANATIAGKADEYFKGFFVTHADNRVIGIVQDSIKEDLLETKSYSGTWSAGITLVSYSGTTDITYKVQLDELTPDGFGNYHYKYIWTKDNWSTSATLVEGDTTSTPATIAEADLSMDGGKAVVTILVAVADTADEDEVSILLEVNYTYFKLSIDGTVTIADTNKLTRFPVTHFNYDNWANVTNVEINKDFPNVVRFYCENYRTLWFGFIKDRNHFYTQTHTIVNDVAGNLDLVTGDIEGLFTGDNDTDKVWFNVNESTDGSNVTIVCSYSYDGVTYIEDASITDSDPLYFQWVIKLGNGLTYTIDCDSDNLANGNNTATVETSLTRGAKWDGFWFGYDTPEIFNRKKYIQSSSAGYLYLEKAELSSELGIRYTFKTVQESNLTNSDRVYSFAIELDGYQTIFIKNILLNSKYYLDETHIAFEKWFDRRITGSLIFELTTEDSINANTITKGDLPTGYLVTQNAKIPGYYKTDEMIITGTDKNATLIMIIDDSYSSNNITELEKNATGSLLNTYLNHYYWKALEVKAKGGTKVGDNILAYNLSEDTMELDKDSKNNVAGIGKTSLTVSGIQNSGINTPSIMTTERIRELARDEILGVKCIYGTSFLLFTETETKWYELDDTNYVFTNVGNFQYGCVASKSIVEASTQDIAPVGTASHRFGARMFNGIYWASYDSIYAFFQNEPIDILDGKWKKEYQEILELTNFDPETDIIGAYNPYMNEVWFWFKLSDETGYTDRIYVYNIDYKHWKKYTYFQTSPAPTEFIKGFAQSNEGMLYWWMDDNIIYTQEPEGTGNKQDYTSGTPGDITFFYEQYINHGNTNIIKTLDRIDLIYDVTPYETGGKYSRVDAYIEIKANAAETSILSSSDLITLQTNVTAAIAGKLYKKRIPIKLRIPNNFIKLKFSSDTSTDSNIKQLKLLQLTINSKISRGTLTKN